jgi:hypothetical protein
MSYVAEALQDGPERPAVTITDLVGDSGSVTCRPDEIAESIGPWYDEMPVREGAPTPAGMVGLLQAEVLTGGAEEATVAWLGVRVETAGHVPVTGDRLRDEVAAAAAAAAGRELGRPVLWADERVTMTITGFSRVNVTLPQPAGTIVITTPDGARTEIDGWEVESWDTVADIAERAGDQWEAAAGLRMSDLDQAQRLVAAAQERLTAARHERDQLIRQAARAGVTAYRVAQVTGLAQPSIGRIFGGGREAR